jgi:thymidylate synthase
MISFEGTVTRKGKRHIEIKNQLKHIVEIWHRDGKNHKRPRQSALQVAIFDPTKDHTGQPVRGFPCLQQVSFSYDDDGGLAVNAYYPTQYMFDRAYGNYLGLCHLGDFMAHEMGLNLVRFTCYIGHPELGKKTKTALRNLARTVQELIPTNSPNS